MSVRSAACVALGALLLGNAAAEVQRVKFSAEQGYTFVEVLRDDLVHVEFGTGGGPSEQSPIGASLMVQPQEHAGPTELARDGRFLRTAELVVEVPESGCVVVKTKADGKHLTTVCPIDLERDWKGFSVRPTGVENVYGLGQYFLNRGTSEGDWLSQGRFRTTGDFGNHFGHFWGGANPQLQFPVLYATGEGGALNYGLFLDNVYKQDWDFKGDAWWQVRMYGTVQFYVMSGSDLLDIRKDYMYLTGRPPVPPRKAFGLWMSEFGYDNWGEVDWKLGGLREGRFPVDGVVLDLQWFGGAWKDSPDSPMGGLKWDEKNFPQPREKIASYTQDHIGVIAIEESYVSKNQWSHGEMHAREGLAHICDTNWLTTFSNWMGQTSMIDWSQKAAGAWWHDSVRKPNIIDTGVMGHWTDLGEPERYDPNSCYRGAVDGKYRHGDVHNLYNLLWHDTIYDGYVRQHSTNNQRPFLLTRSGAPGIQRMGASMWSGDIASRLDVLATHMNVATHMSFAGVDYYGSDVGGFWRKSLYGDESNGLPPDSLTSNGWRPYAPEMFMQWFAVAAWTDVPLRPHVYNCGFTWMTEPGCPYETSPAWMGEAYHRRSNLENLRQRYELIPYYYSLAHRAFLYGEPLVAPPVMYFGSDATVRQMGHQKLIGKDLLVGLVASHGQRKTNVYLPKGTWHNYHTFETVESSGEWIRGVSLASSTDSFRLPVYARGGAILPLMRVDAETKDAYGHRFDGTRDTLLVVRVFANTAASAFTLFEDDGSTVASYDAQKRPTYVTRSTEITQVREAGHIAVTLAAAVGDYTKDETRSTEVQVVCGGCAASAVSLNGASLTQHTTRDAYTQAAAGWFLAGTHILVKTGDVSVRTAKSLQLQL